MEKKYLITVLMVVLSLPTVVFGQKVEYNIKEYGAKGDGKAMDTKAIQSAIDDCHKNGGGIVVVPPGEYLSAPIYLKSNINFYLAPGSILKGSNKLEDYRLELDGMIGDQKNTLGGHINTGENTISGESDRAGLVTAYNANNVSITGQGIIDGNAMAFHDKSKMHWGKEGVAYKKTRQGNIYKDPKFALHDPLAHDERPGNLVRLISCVNARVEDVTFQNSPTWTFQIQSSENVTVRGIRVNSFDSDLRVPNDDGINIQSSTLVRISDSDIHTGDDCIANFDVKKLTVTNCTLSSRSSAIRVGDTRGNIEDCTFSNLVIYSANRALGVYVRASGSVSNVLFSDIVIKNQLFTGHWWGQGEPIHVSALPSNFFGFEEKLGSISNVRFKNIIAETQNGAIVYGCEESIIKDVTFENVKLIIKDSPINDQFGGNFDLRHTTEMEQALFAHDIPGIFARHTKGLTLKDFSVEWADDLPDFFTNAIHCEEFNDLTIDGFKGRSRNPSLHPSISIQNGKQITIRNSKATEGTYNFLKHSNVEDYRLFSGNDLLNAKTTMDPKESNFTTSGNILPKE